MTPPHDVVFLLDVDNTLLDNDQIGLERQARYREIFEKLRTELGYADYLGALQRYRLECLRDPHLLETSLYLVDYPFGSRVYPGALDVIARLRGWGPTVILSDGDVVSSRARSSARDCGRRWQAMS
jgi:FMN phosphatase YigB (HAD superfamily)